MRVGRALQGFHPCPPCGQPEARAAPQSVPQGPGRPHLLAAGHKVFKRLEPRLVVVVPTKPHLLADLLGRGVRGEG